MSSAETIYEWNTGRKIWHLLGCVLMIAVYYLWRDLIFFSGKVSGVTILVAIAWIETAFCLVIDLLRLHSPAYNARIKNLPFYGKAMRRHEETCYNASTYYVLASALLITFCRLGWCGEEILIMSLLVLGFADPAAAWVRFQLYKRHWRGQKIWGFAAFVAVSYLVIRLVDMLGGSRLGPKQILDISIGVALVETYTKDWVALIRPLTRRVQNAIRCKVTEWLFWLYPDDNLVTPLLVALLAIWFTNH